MKVTQRYLFVDEDGIVTQTDDEEKVDKMLEDCDTGNHVVIDLAEGKHYNPEGDDAPINQHEFESDEDEDEESDDEGDGN